MEKQHAPPEEKDSSDKGAQLVIDALGLIPGLVIKHDASEHTVEISDEN
jgi:hypothetical protein